MKKLFFTAIALVAFSGVSMASTVEINKFAVDEVVSCIDQFGIDYQGLRDAGFSESTATAIAGKDYDTCLANNKPVKKIISAE